MNQTYLDCIHCSLNFLCLCLCHWICLCLCLSPRGPKKWWKSCYKRSNLEKEGGRGIRSEDKQCDRVDRTNPTSLILNKTHRRKKHFLSKNLNRLSNKKTVCYHHFVIVVFVWRAACVKWTLWTSRVMDRPWWWSPTRWLQNTQCFHLNVQIFKCLFKS